MKTPSERPIQSFSEFWFYYLDQHSKPLTRTLHATGTVIASFLVFLGFFTAYYRAMLLGVVIGYSFSWAAHFFVEKNKPASFRYPIWSFFSELKMTWLVLSRRI